MDIDDIAFNNWFGLWHEKLAVEYVRKVCQTEFVRWCKEKYKNVK